MPHFLNVSPPRVFHFVHSFFSCSNCAYAYSHDCCSYITTFVTVCIVEKRKTHLWCAIVSSFEREIEHDWKIVGFSIIFTVDSISSSWTLAGLWKRHSGNFFFKVGKKSKKKIRIRERRKYFFCHVLDIQFTKGI